MSTIPEFDVGKTLRSIEDDLPLPVANGLKLYRDIHPDRYSERIDALLKVFEASTKFVSSIAARACLLEATPGDDFRTTLQSFRRPALGSWVALLRGALAGVDAQPAEGLLPLLKSWYESSLPDGDEAKQIVKELYEAIQVQPPRGRLTNAKVLDLLVTFRNKGSGHGSRVSAHEYRKRHDLLQALALPWFRGLVALRDYPLAYVEEVRVRGGEYYQTLRVGWGKEFELREVKTDEPLLDARLYCFRFDELGKPVFAVDLSPFLLFRPCPSCMSDQLFFFNGQARAVEYLSYGCGHFLSVDEPSGELGSIEKFLGGQISLHQLFHGKILGRKIEPGPVGPSREARARARQLVTIARGMLRKGLPSEAAASIREALAFDPDSSESHLTLALAQLASAAEPNQVLKTLKRAMELDPDGAPAHYAFGRLASLIGHTDLAQEALRRAHSLDPSNQDYYSTLEQLPQSPGVQIDMSSDATLAAERLAGLAREVLDARQDPLPEIHWWVSALPPWSWIRRRPLSGSAAMAIGTLFLVIILNIHNLTRLQVVWFTNIALLVFLGLLAPFLFPIFVRQLYSQLKAVVSLPSDTFRRWFLAEIVPFAGSYHLSEEKRYGMKNLFAQDRFHGVAFLGGFLLFFPLQTACAMGMDPFDGSLAAFSRYSYYYLEIYVLAWIPAFVVRALAFIPGFKDVPIRHFVDMPSSVSLKPLGKFYLKIAALGSAAYLLFTSQHYFYRTHQTVPFASLGFILVVYGLFFAMMFASQAVIMLTMSRLRERRLIEFSLHLESAFNDSMQMPSEKTFDHLRRHREYMQTLRQGLSIGGFTGATLSMFLFLALLQVSTFVVYWFLVTRGVWLP